MTGPAVAEAWRALLDRGAAGFEDLGRERVEEAWNEAISVFADPASSARRRVAAGLREQLGSSAPCLDASLDALLAGFDPDSVARVFARAKPSYRAPLVTLLAANVPGLVLQPLLTCLALERPVLIKQARHETHFGAGFLETLTAIEPRLDAVCRIAAWQGGDRAIEMPLFAQAESVIAYGGADAIASLRDHLGPRLIAFGPKASIAVVGAEENLEVEALTTALARDVALFDQRGCLSLQAVYVVGDDAATGCLRRVADGMARALTSAARVWPPGEPTTHLLGQVRQEREEAELLGQRVAALPLRTGTVITDPRPIFRPSPGLRTVRVHPVATGDLLCEILAPWRGRLQGAALAGRAALELRTELASLGLSRTCDPGELQSPDATWENGGVDLLTVLSEPPAASAPGPSD